VVRRRGELTAAGIDREWPHQVALRSGVCRGTYFRTLQAFCLDLSLCPRGHSVYHEDEWWHVFCFAEEAHAEAFQLRFGGERFNPKDRGRGRRWARWYKDGR